MKKTMRKAGSLFLALALFLSFALIAPPASLAAGQPEANPRFFMIGDSIVAANGAGSGTGTQGWGAVFAQYFDGVSVTNNAVAARSAKQFITEGRLDSTVAAVSKGDVVFIQWGHNDACYGRQARYSPVGDINTAGTYQNYLKQHIDAIRAKGGIPVLITVPATHNNTLWYDQVIGPDCTAFPATDAGLLPPGAVYTDYISNEAMFYNAETGRFLPSFPKYANGSREVAKAMDVPLIDLNKLTMDYFNSLPNKAEGILYTDGVHLTTDGANAVARIAAENMVLNKIPGYEYVKASVALPTTWKFDLGGTIDGYTPIAADSAYSPLNGYGWQMNDVYSTLKTTAQTNSDPLRQSYISGDIKGEGTNAPQTVNGTGETRQYTYPTFLVDLPVGVYDVTVTIGRETGSYNSGAIIEGVMNAVPWCNYPTDGNTDNFRANAARTADTYVATAFRAAVWDGQLTIELASFEGNANAISMACGIEITPAALPEAGEKPTIHIVGDSTAAQGGGGASVGYGTKLPDYFTDGVLFNNKAVSGLAARTYIGGGYLNTLLTTNVKPGDYVFIDWGHNDFSRERTGRYADPSPGGVFEQAMQRYVDAARAFGATPVILAPVNQYYNGDPTRIGASGYNRNTKEWIGVSFTDWRARERDIAERDGVAFLDITPIMADCIQGLGYDGCAFLYYDGTHLSAAGAEWAAGNYSRLLAKTDSALAPYSIYYETEPEPLSFKFDFGTASGPAAYGYTKVTPASDYTAEAGFGWKNPSGVTITATNEAVSAAPLGDYISGNNVKSGTGNNVTYLCPTFVVDVPNGIYDVCLIRGSAFKYVTSGATIEESFNAIPWFSDALPNVYTAEPTKPIVAAPGWHLNDIARVAVCDGQLTIEITASMTDDGVSGVAVVNAIEITRIDRDTEPSAVPRLFAVGDSTTATYPPFTSPDLAPIPEQTGWGSVIDRFFSPEVETQNWALGGMSAKNYLTEGFWNDVLLKIKPGDVVLIEWGINESAAGRRYIAADATFDAWLRRYTDAVTAFGAIPVLVSGSSAGSGYVTRFAAVADADGIGYVNLQGQWSAYRSARTSAQQGYLTIDGTHPSRVGGIVMAQIVANGMKSISGLAINAWNTAPALTAANTAPAYVPENLRIKRQTENTVTLAWDCPEEIMYDTAQLITRFPIYRRAAGGADNPTEIAEGTAYVLAGMDGSNLSLTIENSGDYEYFVAARGVNGTGAMSGPITVGTYTATTRDKLEKLLEFYRKANMWDYTYFSFRPFKSAALSAIWLLDTGAGQSELDAVLAELQTAYDGLVRIMTTYMFDDFEGAFASNWGTTQDPSGVDMTRIFEEDGNRYLNYYVSAAGERSRRKTFTSYPASSKTSVQFEWYSSLPDSRNVTELRFYSGTATSSLFFGLKASSNGHIGYFASSTAPNIRGDGFHDGSARDLWLPTGVWYLVDIEFDFVNKIANLNIRFRDEADAEKMGYSGVTVIASDIPLPDTATTLSFMRFHAARGQNDTGGNDLSVLWTCAIDNFGIYWLPVDYSVDRTAFDAAVARAEELDEDEYTAESFNEIKLALIDAGTIENYFHCFKSAAQSDIDYAVELIDAAIAGLVTKGNQPRIISVEYSGFTSLVAGYAANIPVTVTAENADGLDLFVMLFVDGTIAATAKVADGKALIKAPAINGATAYIQAGLIGDVDGMGLNKDIPIRPLPADIWKPEFGSSADAVTAVFFGDTIRLTATAAVKIDGVPVTGFRAEGRVLYIEAEVAPGQTVEMKGVKYPELFPSYSFTFTVQR